MTRSRILIVEDELIVAEDLRMTLTTLGYDVIGISPTGEHALELAAEQRPDVVLMDIMLAGELDGIATAAKIRAQYDIPVIYVTAYADENLVARAKLTEPFGYIVKPFNEREVHSNIEITLYRYRTEKELRKRDAILLGIGAGIEWFLREYADSTDGGPTGSRGKKEPDCFPLLENIGNAMDLDRIVILRNDAGGDTVSLQGEWIAGIAAPLPRSSPMQKIRIGDLGPESLAGDLKKGKVVPLRIDEIKPPLQEFFRTYHFGSIAALQLSAFEQPYGILLYVSSGERAWPPGELEAMRIAANIIGGVVGLSDKRG